MDNIKRDITEVEFERGTRFSLYSKYLGRCGVRVPARARDFTVLQNVQTGPGAHLATCSKGTGLTSPGVKRP